MSLLFLFCSILNGMQNTTNEHIKPHVREAIYRDFKERYASLITLSQQQGALVVSVDGKPSIELRSQGYIVAELIVVLNDQKSINFVRRYDEHDEIDSMSKDPCCYT